jgi:hypothetical protein
VHDVKGVEVVDAAQYLLDNHSSVLLNKLAAFLHFVEQVSAHAEGNDEVDAFTVFVNLVELHDVWVVLHVIKMTYKFFQNIYFVLHLGLLGLSQDRLSDYLYTALQVGFLVHNDPQFPLDACKIG